jgi:hypothetical protein
MICGELVLNRYEGCVRSVQIPNMTNKTFLNFPYIFRLFHDPTSENFLFGMLSVPQDE